MTKVGLDLILILTVRVKMGQSVRLGSCVWVQISSRHESRTGNGMHTQHDTHMGIRKISKNGTGDTICELK